VGGAASHGAADPLRPPRASSEAWQARAASICSAARRRWGETPVFVDPLVLVGLVLLVVNMSVPIFQSDEPGLYVSLWYFLAAFAWTGLVYFMGNYLPQFWVPGTAGAAITGLFIHDLVGLFVTPIGWGLMYYFVPLLLQKPIWSHALSLIGFWGIAFFYPMQGVHHFLLSPIPMYARTASWRRSRSGSS
jgi:cytochrome c oxidase cbb3-type subunit 1